MSGHIGGDAFRAAWRQLQQVMLNDPDARIIQGIELYRNGDRVEIELRLPVGFPPSAEAETTETGAID